MGEYSKKELEVIENLTSEISSKIFGLHLRSTDKIRMIYSKCRSSTEKNKYTDEQIQQLLQEIKNADDNIAVYLGAITDEDSVHDIDKIISNFLTQEFQEDIEQLATDDFEAEEYNYLPAFYELNSDAEEMVLNFVKSANDTFLLNDFQCIKNSVESEFKESIVSYLRSKVHMAVYSKRVWDFDRDENYYSYALSLNSKTPVLLKLQSENEKEVKKMWAEYSPYITTTKDVDIDFESSIDYIKYIWDYLHTEIKNTLSLSLEWDMVLNRRNFLTNVPEINTPEAKEKINRFADFVYSLYLDNLFTFLLKLPETTESIEDILQEINLEFKKIENFANGIYEDYKYYDFDKSLTKLFYLGVQPKNAHINMDHLSEVYWKLFQQISYYSDQGMYPDHVSENEEFTKMANKVDLILNNRIKEFIFFDPNKDEEEKPLSINDFSILPNTSGNQDIASGISSALSSSVNNPGPDENQKDNEALDNLLESLHHKLPTDKGPFEAFNLWDSNLIKFKREVLHTLSKQRAENKKHYLDMVRIELEEKTKNVFVTDEDYDFLLSQHSFDRMTVMENTDSDDMLIGALASSPILLDPSMGTDILFYEAQKDIQDTFYNFHYGQTLEKALNFVERESKSLNEAVIPKQEEVSVVSNVENLEELFLQDMYGENFMPEIKEISNIHLFDTLKTLPLYIHKVKAPANNYFRWQNLKTNLHREVSSNLLRLSIENKKIYLLKLIAEFESWSHYYDYSEKLLDDWILKNGIQIIKAIRAQEKTKDYYNLLHKPFEYFENEKVDEQVLDQIKIIRENINNFLFAQFIEYCLSFLYEFRNNIDPSLQSNQLEIKKEINFNFDSLTTEKQNYILHLLEDLSLTNNGESIISERKKSALRGVAEALIEKNILSLSLEKSYRLIAEKINVKIRSKIDSSYTSDSYKEKALKYITDYPFK